MRSARSPKPRALQVPADRVAADGAVTTIGYDLGCNKPATITDALGASTRLRYDGAGNLLSVTDAGAGLCVLALVPVSQIAG